MTATAGLAELEARVAAALERVEAGLGGAVTSADPFVGEAASYLINAGGKRLRATLVLLGGHFGDAPDSPQLVDAAVAVELTHLSTLYHDDVMDEAELRRGNPSANARYDNKVAILTGDYLFARASEVTAGLGSDAVVLLARAVARLVQGQIRDVRGPVDGEDPIAHYMGVLTDKTGALIAAACRLGGMLAGASDGALDALTDYGERLGVAFQLGDDLLDITREAATSGKQPGADLREGVRTLPMLYLLDAGGPDAERLRRFFAGERDDAAVAEALALLRASPALVEARRIAQREIDAAVAALEPLPAVPARHALVALARGAADREV